MRALRGEAARREKRGLSRLAPSVTRVVICVSWAFCSTDQEKETLFAVYLLVKPINFLTSFSVAIAVLGRILSSLK